MLIPQLTPDTVADAAVGVPPPTRFRALNGVPHDVHWRYQPYHPARGLTDAQKSGLRYETQVHDYLAPKLGSFYHVAPFITFRDGQSRRSCVPDAIHVDASGRATIFEIKSQHMPEAWWQLRGLYEPVVQQLRFVNVVSCVEVVRSYDPMMGFPEEITLFHNIAELLEAAAAPFKVLLWRL